RAVETVGLAVDSSINAAADISVPDLPDTADLFQPSRIGNLLSLPLTVFRDRFGKTRPAQIGSCSISELCQVIDNANDNTWPAVVMLSHNFEMMRPDSTKIDPIVLDRFERLCAYAASCPELCTPPGNLLTSITPSRNRIEPPHISVAGTMRRFVEQVLRRGL